MLRNIQMEERHKKIIAAILKKYPYTFYAFGSRINNKAKKFSDLDLCYKEIIPDSIVVHIEEDFENSDLPFKVDLVSWHRCDDAFKSIIDKEAVTLFTE